MFAFCEPDDEVEANWLSSIAQGLATADLVAGPLDHTKLNSAWLLKVFGNGSQMDDFCRFYLKPEIRYTSGCNLAFHRAVYEALGPLDESLRYVWDIDFCWQVKLSNFKLQFLPDMRVQYRLPTTLTKMYKRARRWSEEHVELQRRYQVSRVFCWQLRHGVYLFRCSVRLIFCLLTYPLLGSKVPLAKSMLDLGQAVGHLQGCLKRPTPRPV